MEKSNNNIPILWHSVETAIRAIASGRSAPKKVLILGAGMAGMSAAYELGKRSEIDTIDILEASARVGGRVWTHKFEGTDQIGEFGAMRIPEERHDYTFHYMNEFNLRTREFIAASDSGYYDIRGTMVNTDLAGRTQIVNQYPGLTNAEKSIIINNGAGGLLARHMNTLMARLKANDWQLGRALVNGNMNNEFLRWLDAQTTRGYLLRLVEEKKLSSDGMAMIGAMTSLESRWLWSLASNLRGTLTTRPPNGKGLVEIIGGFGRLPEEMETRLNSSAYEKVTTHHGHAITQIDIEGNNVIVYTKDGEQKWEGYDKVICALPFGVMRLITLNGFSNTKISAIRNLKYSSSTKVLLMCKSAFWQKGKKSIYGSSISDRLSRQTYYPSPVTTVKREEQVDTNEDLYWNVDSRIDDRPIPKVKSSSPESERRVLLGSYSWSTNSRQLGNLSKRDDDPESIGSKMKDNIDSDRARHVINDLKHIHPELDNGQFEKSASIYWDEHKWTKGAFAITPPGDLTSYFSDSIRPEANGNLYFAGEHVSIAPGWIQGALQSGLKAAANIVGIPLKDFE